MHIDAFKCLITCGEFTKAQLIARLEQLKRFNSESVTVISDEDYSDILALIKASELA